MIKSQSSGGIILNKKKKIVLVKENSGHWGFPKGHIKEGEDILETALREIYEETSLKKLNLIKKLGVYQRFNMRKTDFKTIHMYLFISEEDKLFPQHHDVIDCQWFFKKDVIENLLYLEDKQFFQSIINEI